MQFFNFFPPSGKVPCTRVSREKDHSVFEHVLPCTKDLKKNGGGGVMVEVQRGACRPEQRSLSVTRGSVV